MLHGAGGTGISLHLHVSILLSTRFFFFMLICPFLMLPPFFLMLHGAGGTGDFPPSPCLHPVVDTFLFCANLSFSYAVPLFFLCSTAEVGRGGGGTLLQDPTFFGAILYAERFFYAAFVLFLCSMGRFPSISMSLPPSPCLHPVVDMFVFLCPRVFLLCVRFPLLCHRCLFLMLICPFLMLPPLLLMFHGAGGTGGTSSSSTTSTSTSSTSTSSTSSTSTSTSTATSRPNEFLFWVWCWCLLPRRLGRSNK